MGGETVHAGQRGRKSPEAEQALRFWGRRGAVEERCAGCSAQGSEMSCLLSSSMLTSLNVRTERTKRLER